MNQLSSLLEDDVDEGGDVRDVDNAVAVNVATGHVLWDHEQNHVDEGGDIAYIHGSVAVHIPFLSLDSKFLTKR